MDLTREHPDRYCGDLPPLVVDRQRVLHSSAFRRLQYKTQVFLATEGDHFRTRLTHTLEVANFARLLADRLEVSTDLAEVVALAHDLGHPPFGHAGEEALRRCMLEHGGFEHNAHALRVVEYLEHPYPEFRGLNLTRDLRSSVAKHTTRFDRPGPHPLQDGLPPPLEGQIAALADWLSYILHDLQDGLVAGLATVEHLADCELWREHFSPGENWRGRVRPAIDRIQQEVLRDVAAETSRRIADPPPGEPLVAMGARMRSAIQAIEAVVTQYVYRDPLVARMDSKARRIVTAIFEAYVSEPQLLPRRYAARVAEQGVQRVAADYIAGMTDRFCLAEHARLFDPRMEV